MTAFEAVSVPLKIGAAFSFVFHQVKLCIVKITRRPELAIGQLAVVFRAFEAALFRACLVKSQHLRFAQILPRIR